MIDLQQDRSSGSSSNNNNNNNNNNNSSSLAAASIFASKRQITTNKLTNTQINHTHPITHAHTYTSTPGGIYCCRLDKSCWAGSWSWGAGCSSRWGMAPRPRTPSPRCATATVTATATAIATAAATVILGADSARGPHAVQVPPPPGGDQTERPQSKETERKVQSDVKQKLMIRLQ